WPVGEAVVTHQTKKAARNPAERTRATTAAAHTPWPGRRRALRVSVRRRERTPRHIAETVDGNLQGREDRGVAYPRSAAFVRVATSKRWSSAAADRPVIGALKSHNDAPLRASI